MKNCIIALIFLNFIIIYLNITLYKMVFDNEIYIQLLKHKNKTILNYRCIVHSNNLLLSIQKWREKKIHFTLLCLS